MCDIVLTGMVLLSWVSSFFVVTALYERLSCLIAFMSAVLKAAENTKCNQTILHIGKGRAI